MSTDPLFMKIGTAYYYYHNDHLGTPQKMTSVSRAVVWSAKHSSFGKASIEVESVTNNLRFPGQYYDAENGLYYNFHRYYDPALGRYTRTDPSGLNAGLNLYAYVDENPINWMDSNGLEKTNSEKLFFNKVNALWKGFNNLNAAKSICSCSKFISIAQNANTLCRKEHDLYVEKYAFPEGDINYMGHYEASFISDAYLSCTGKRLVQILGIGAVQKYYNECFNAAISLMTLPL